MDALESKDKLRLLSAAKRALFKKKRFKKLIALLATVAALILIFYFVDIDSIITSLSQMNFAWAFVALVLYAISLIFRAVRVRQILTFQLDVYKAVYIVSAYSVLNYFIPLKLGEVSMPLMLRREGVSVEESIWVWLLSRILDLLFVVMIGVYIFWSYFAGVLLSSYSFVIVGGVVLGALLLRLMVIRSVYFSNFCRFLLGFKFVDAIRIAFSTVLSWLLVYYVYYYLFVAIGLDVDISVCVTALVLMAPITFLPVNSFASVGGFQAAWVGALVLNGWQFDAAFSASVLLHILISMVVLLVGALLMMVVKFSERRGA